MAPKPVKDVLGFFHAPWTLGSNRSFLPCSSSALTQVKDCVGSSLSAVSRPFTTMAPKSMGNVLEFLHAPWTSDSDRSFLPSSDASTLTQVKDYVGNSLSAVTHPFSVMVPKSMRDVLEFPHAPRTFDSNRSFLPSSYASALTRFKDYVSDSFSAVAHPFSIMALKYIKYILFISDRCILLWSYVSILISLVTIITPIVVLAIPFVPAIGVLAISSIPTIGIPAIPFVPTIVSVAMAVIRWSVSVVRVFTIIQKMFVVRIVPHELWMLFLRCLGFRRRGVQRGSLAAIYQSTVYGGNVLKGSMFASFQSSGMRG